MQFHRLQNISVTIQIKENASVLPSWSECLCLTFQREKNNMFSVCVHESKKGQTDRQTKKLTSSVSSPDHGCGSAGSPGEAWCPAALPSVSGTSSSAAAQSAAHPHYLSADQPAAARVHTQTHAHTFLLFFYDSLVHIIIIASMPLTGHKCVVIKHYSRLNILKSFLPFSRGVFCPAVPSPACHQTPAAVSFWWSPFHEWLGCILSATRLLEERHTIQKMSMWHLGFSCL